jgi:phosphatidylinositol kinase/protein kinase (PI-3  family)
MKLRGYPVGDFEQNAADLSVDHPKVVTNYRAAHAIAVRDQAGEGSTEDLRQAMVSYRALFEELLDQHVMEHEEVRQ